MKKASVKILKEHLERFPDKTSDESTFKQLAAIIIESMSKEELQQLFDFKKIPFDAGDEERKYYQMCHMIPHYENGKRLYSVFNSEKLSHEEKMKILFDLTEGGRCSYYEVSLKELPVPQTEC
jgi:hypothetical protein